LQSSWNALGIIRDITGRKKTELSLQEKTQALLSSNGDLERFAYSVSHDMRQPLRAISGHLQLLQMGLKKNWTRIIVKTWLLPWQAQNVWTR